MRLVGKARTNLGTIGTVIPFRTTSINSYEEILVTDVRIQFSVDPRDDQGLPETLTGGKVYAMPARTEVVNAQVDIAAGVAVLPNYPVTAGAYDFAMTVIDNDGNESPLSNIFRLTVMSGVPLPPVIDAVALVPNA